MEDKTTHTPGPWTATSDTERTGHVIAGPEGFEVGLFVAAGPATNGHPDGNGYANARLIAAAPDLLAAVKEALELFAYLKPEIFTVETSAKMETIRAAIARAEGR